MFIARVQHMNPLKYWSKYVYVTYLTYIRIHMVIRMKFNSMQYFSATDARNRYDYILALQRNNILIQ